MFSCLLWLVSPRCLIQRPALFPSMQEQSGMLQAEFIQLKDISVSKASLHDTLQLALIAQSWHLGSVMQTEA